jgi:membrane protein YqaA with SNARE-associated domain
MPVGRFRKNPRELDEVERRVFAAQYPEGSLLFGMGAGLVAPMAAGAFLELPSVVGTLGTGVGPLFGGVFGYLLGHVYRQMRIESLREESEKKVPENTSVAVEKD